MHRSGLKAELQPELDDAYVLECAIYGVWTVAWATFKVV
ncbi:MAG: hypothetical protein ACI9ZV_000867 [Candidatus Azotimanducaceae bacterium]|jgi:hypothetical protein